ncbi:hypothetical protein DXG01_010651 [Tephrocybe rancida]|nr:hypothetical protein DXG01_010651 [Tephrocybe rancida]
MGLNAVRFLSVVSLILVFASTILVMVHNIQAVNTFLNHSGAADMRDCDYIEISTQILSHHVDDFTLVSAFFLFALGCVNMFLGLVFRESAKERRSITSWRAETKSILPTHTGDSKISRPGFVPRQFTGEKDLTDRPDSAEFDTWRSSEKAGYGFGRQGEKAANLRGFILQRPEESLPRYASPTPPPQDKKYHEEHHVSLSRTPSTSSTASSSSSFTSPYRESQATSVPGVKAPSFKSSPTAL